MEEVPVLGVTQSLADPGAQAADGPVEEVPDSKRSVHDDLKLMGDDDDVVEDDLQTKNNAMCDDDDMGPVGASRDVMEDDLMTQDGDKDDMVEYEQQRNVMGDEGRMGPGGASQDNLP